MPETGAFEPDPEAWDAWAPEEVAERLAGLDVPWCVVAGDGYVRPLDSPGRRHHQTWVREPGTKLWRLDIMCDPSAGDTWICRGHPGIRRPYAEIIQRTPDGVPYLVPEIALLFEGKHIRAKDEADFAGVLPRLTAAQRRWLAESLAIAYGADHRWIDALE